MGKEQRKALTEVIRNASQGHFNESRYNTVQGQYRDVATKLQQREAEIKKFEEDRQVWNSALTAISMGDSSKLAAIINAFKSSLGKTGITPEGFVPQDQVAAERAQAEAGMQFWTNEIVPAAYDVARNYNADPKEVQNAVKWYVENEPNLTRERLDEIIQIEELEEKIAPSIGWDD